MESQGVGVHILMLAKTALDSLSLVAQFVAFSPSPPCQRESTQASPIICYCLLLIAL
jgi:hypothetical protein